MGKIDQTHLWKVRQPDFLPTRVKLALPQPFNAMQMLFDEPHFVLCHHV